MLHPSDDEWSVVAFLIVFGRQQHHGRIQRQRFLSAVLRHFCYQIVLVELIVALVLPPVHIVWVAQLTVRFQLSLNDIPNLFIEHP